MKCGTSLSEWSGTGLIAELFELRKAQLHVIGVNPTLVSWMMDFFLYIQKWQQTTNFACPLLRWVCRKLGYPCLSVSSVSFPCVILSGPQTSSGFSVSLFWPKQLDMQKGVIQPVKKRWKRCKCKMDKSFLSQNSPFPRQISSFHEKEPGYKNACSTAGVSQLPCPEAEAHDSTNHSSNGAHSTNPELITHQRDFLSWD